MPFAIAQFTYFEAIRESWSVLLGRSRPPIG